MCVCVGVCVCERVNSRFLSMVVGNEVFSQIKSLLCLDIVEPQHILGVGTHVYCVYGSGYIIIITLYVWGRGKS